MKKIVISIHTERYKELFYDTGTFVELEKYFDVVYLKNLPLETLNYKGDAVPIIEPIKYKRPVSFFLDKYSFLSMWRYRRRSTSFVLKFTNYIRSVSNSKRLAIKLLSVPVVFEIFSYCFKKLLFPTLETLELLHELNPDLLIVPSCGTSDGISMDLIAGANKLNIPSLLLMYNWDNITCKGVFPFQATYAGVWGKQSAEHYEKIHKLDPSDIFILGSPQFSVYETFDQSTRNNLRSDWGLSKNQLIGAYLGGARYRDDILLLKKIDPILDKLNIQLIYRPHPFQDRDMTDGGNFFLEEFSNITMDLTMIKHYKRCRSEPLYNVRTYSSSYDSLPPFLHSLDFVVSSYSTMAIESMIMGKPVLLTAFPDTTFKYSFDKLKLYEHHNCWQKFMDVVVCNDAGHLESDFRKVTTLTRNEAVSERLKKEVRYVCHSDTDTYSKRLLNCVQSLQSL